MKVKFYLQVFISYYFAHREAEAKRKKKNTSFAISVNPVKPQFLPCFQAWPACLQLCLMPINWVSKLLWMQFLKPVLTICGVLCCVDMYKRKYLDIQVSWENEAWWSYTVCVCWCELYPFQGELKNLSLCLWFSSKDSELWPWLFHILTRRCTYLMNPVKPIQSWLPSSSLNPLQCNLLKPWFSTGVKSFVVTHLWGFEDLKRRRTSCYLQDGKFHWI